MFRARRWEKHYRFVHADDFAEVCIQASHLKGADQFNCGTDRFGMTREVLEHLCHHVATGSTVKSLPRWPIVAAMNLSARLGISPLGSYHASMYGLELTNTTERRIEFMRVRRK